MTSFARTLAADLLAALGWTLSCATILAVCIVVGG
jgi:hypothetical protein